MIVFVAIAAVAAAAFVMGTEVLIRVKVEPFSPMNHYIAMFNSAEGTDVAFGDSVVMSGFSGQPGWLNMALGGDGLREIVAKVRLYYRHRQPGRVIVEVAPHHLSAKYLRPAEGDGFEKQLRPLAWWRLRVAEDVYRAGALSYWWRFLWGEPLNDSVTFEPDGARLNWTRFTRFSEAERRVGGSHTAAELRPLPNFRDLAVLPLLDALLVDLKARGARVCLVTYPAARPMSEAARSWPSYAEARAHIAAMAAARAVRYLDLFESAMPDELFADGQHINGFGAKDNAALIVSRCFGDGGE